MSYSFFKKLGQEDDELMKTNLMLNGVGATRWRLEVSSLWNSPLGASLLLPHSSSSRCKVYSVILGRDWIHTNHCIPSTLHQFLIQWIDDEVEVVHMDVSAYIALADVTADWQHGSTQCLLGKDLTSYDFFSISKYGFVPVFVQSAFETQLRGVVFQ
jgi:hypothetical protein